MPAATSNEDLDTKEARFRHPSGILYLLGQESVPIILDALLDLPPGREFNKTEFADHAGLTRQTVATHLDRLLETDVVEPVPETSPQRYRVTESPVVQELYEFNSAINAVRPDRDEDLGPDRTVTNDS